MDLTEIPFVKKVGIKQSDDGDLALPMEPSISNHLNTIHASAQFTLAETASGKLLMESFPELVGKVVPVLRDSHIKFKRPADSAITAHASMSDEASQSLMAQLERRGRGSIEIGVEIRDASNKITCTGLFNWFIQSIV